MLQQECANGPRANTEPTGLLWREGRGQAPARTGGLVGNPKGETFHISCRCCMQSGIHSPSLGCPCLALYWPSLGTHRTAAPPEPTCQFTGNQALRCLGMFLLPSQIWFTIQPKTAETPLQEKVTWDCFTALVPRAASLKQWPEAH